MDIPKLRYVIFGFSIAIYKNVWYNLLKKDNEGDIMKFEILKNCLDGIMTEYNTPGVDCIVYKEHKPVFRYFNGFADVENVIKTDENTLYLIYSMTKMLTCTSMLQLYEKGKFKLDDELSLYMSEFKNMLLDGNGADRDASKKVASGEGVTKNIVSDASEYANTPITIRHLFTMTSGFDYAMWTDDVEKCKNEGRTSTKDIVSEFSKKTLRFEPGTRFQYGLSHDILGALVEILSGMTLGEYMSENIFKPLGMKDTFFGIPKDEKRLLRMAVRYNNKGNEIERLELENSFNLTDDYESGGAGLVSSTDDYGLFLDALANGGMGKTGNRILLPTTVELMHTNQLTGLPLEDFDAWRRGYGYGLGVRTHIDPERSGSLSPVGEFGWDGAAGAFAMVDTKNKIALAYFQQMQNWDVAILNKIRNALYKSIEDK